MLPPCVRGRRSQSSLSSQWPSHALPFDRRDVAFTENPRCVPGVAARTLYSCASHGSRPEPTGTRRALAGGTCTCTGHNAPPASVRVGSSFLLREAPDPHHPTSFPGDPTAPETLISE